jgi:hypothetical protein
MMVAVNETGRAWTASSFVTALIARSEVRGAGGAEAPFRDKEHPSSTAKAAITRFIASDPETEVTCLPSSKPLLEGYA